VLTGGGDAVSRTLDYGFADFATAQAFVVLAKKLGAGDAAAAQVCDRYMCTRTDSAYCALC
jgi:putative alpha-1,2-mannosidase